MVEEIHKIKKKKQEVTKREAKLITLIYFVIRSQCVASL